MDSKCKKIEQMTDHSCQQLSLTVFYDPLFPGKTDQEMFLIFPWVRIEISIDFIPEVYWLNASINSFVSNYIKEQQLGPLAKYTGLIKSDVDMLTLDPRLTLFQKVFDCIILRYRREPKDEGKINNFYKFRLMFCDRNTLLFNTLGSSSS